MRNPDETDVIEYFIDNNIIKLTSIASKSLEDKLVSTEGLIDLRLNKQFQLSADLLIRQGAMVDISDVGL